MSFVIMKGNGGLGMKKLTLIMNFIVYRLFVGHDNLLYLLPLIIIFIPGWFQLGGSLLTSQKNGC